MAYWTDLQHGANGSNLVTMYNQTTHHHHHHVPNLVEGNGGGAGTGTGGPLRTREENGVPSDDNAEGDGDGTMSSATSNSEVVGSARNSRPTSLSKHVGASSAEANAEANAVMTTKVANGERCVEDGREDDRLIRPEKTSKTHKELDGKKNMTEAQRSSKDVAGAQSFVDGVSKDGVGSKRCGSASVGSARATSTTSKEATEGNTQMEKTPEQTRVEETRLNGVGPKRGVTKKRLRHDERTEKTAANVRRSTVKESDTNEQGCVGVMNQNTIAGALGVMFMGETGNGEKKSRSDLVRRATNGLDMRSGRPLSKRARNGVTQTTEVNGKEKWNGSYMGAGNGNMMHDDEVVREITPPSDREETPEDQGNGSGSGGGSGDGDGTGSGSGDGTGSGSGDGTGSGSGSGDGTGSGSGDGGGSTGGREGSGESDEGKRDVRRRGTSESVDPPSPSMRNGVKGGRRRATSSNWGHVNVNGNGNASASNNGRYETLVHNCVSLGVAQWNTDKAYRITLMVGSKNLLAAAGVTTVGRHAVDGVSGTTECVDNVDEMRGLYESARDGERMEWVARKGRKRYLVVLAPFRKHGGEENSGVAGMIMEVKQNQELEGSQ